MASAAAYGASIISIYQHLAKYRHQRNKAAKRGNNDAEKYRQSAMTASISQ